MGTKKLTNVDYSESMDSIFVNDDKKVRQVKKSNLVKLLGMEMSNGVVFKGKDTTSNIIAKEQPSIGDKWFSTDENVYYMYSSNGWVNVGSGEDYSNIMSEFNELKGDIGQLSEEMAKLNGLTYGIYVGDIEPTNGVMYWLDTSDNGSTESEIIPATGINLDKTTLAFTDSANQTLIATVEPSNSTDTVTWESSNTSIATVKNGIVTPVANGSCTITAKAGNYYATCEVTVDVTEEIVTLSSISATYTGGDVIVGTSLDDLTGITVTATYSDGSNTEVTDYTLSGEIVEGSNTITVSYGGNTTTFTVTGVAESGGDTTDISALILNEPYLVDEETVENDWGGNNNDFVTSANKNNTPTVCALAIANQTPITDYFNSSYDVLYGVVYYPNRSDPYGAVTANVWRILAYKDNYGAPATQEVARCAFTINRTSDYKCYSYKLVKEDVISAIEATDYTQDDIIKISLPNQSNSKNAGLKSFWMATEPTMKQLEAIRDFFANGGEL